jgi:ribosomal protein S18 acetylase RimI-like enzyme
MILARQDDVILRHANDDDLPALDALTILCYSAIQASYEAMLGAECYEAVRPDPELTWQERKCGQVHRLYQAFPEGVWALEEAGEVFGFVTLYLVREKNYGAIANNGVHPRRQGQGWGKFMYQHVLDYFRAQGLRYAYVDTGLDDAHIPARRAYEAVGFDRQVPVVEYWQDLSPRPSDDARK